jgi:hypothetical protein
MEIINFKETRRLEEVIYFLSGILEQKPALLEGRFLPTLHQQVCKQVENLEVINKKYDFIRSNDIDVPSLNLFQDAINRLHFLMTSRQLNDQLFMQYLKEVIDYLEEFANDLDSEIVYIVPEGNEETETERVKIRYIKDNIEFKKDWIGNKENAAFKGPVEVAKALIAENRTEDAIEHLLVFTSTEDKYEKVNNNYLLIKSRFIKWKEEDLIGIKDNSALAGIKKDLLNSLDGLKKLIKE